MPLGFAFVIFGRSEADPGLQCLAGFLPGALFWAVAPRQVGCFGASSSSGLGALSGCPKYMGPCGDSVPTWSTSSTIGYVFARLSWRPEPEAYIFAIESLRGHGDLHHPVPRPHLAATSSQDGPWPWQDVQHGPSQGISTGSESMPRFSLAHVAFEQSGGSFDFFFHRRRASHL